MPESSTYRLCARWGSLRLEAAVSDLEGLLGETVLESPKPVCHVEPRAKAFQAS
jgi:hypothetical protein